MKKSALHFPFSFSTRSKTSATSSIVTCNVYLISISYNCCTKEVTNRCCLNNEIFLFDITYQKWDFIHSLFVSIPLCPCMSACLWFLRGGRDKWTAHCHPTPYQLASRCYFAEKFIFLVNYSFQKSLMSK